MDKQYEAVKAAVARGYQWLVTEGPRFGLDLELIDTGDLEISSNCRCIIGQASGAWEDRSYEYDHDQLGFNAVMARLASAGVVQQDRWLPWGREHGFVWTPAFGTPAEMEAEWHVTLTEHWERESVS